MRGLTVAVVAGVLVVLVAAALYLRSGDTGSESTPRLAPAGGGGGAYTQPQGASNPQASSKGMERSSRVEERLSQLRDDFEHRQLGAANPTPSKREVPTMGPNQRKKTEDEDDQDDADLEDPAEMESLKHTLLSDPDPDERIGAVLMLTGEEGPESLSMLVEAMGDPDPEVRLAVVEALGDRAEELSPETLGPAMKDSDAEVRFEAVSILGDMETPEALQMVRNAENDPDPDVSELAKGIGDFVDDEGQPGTGTTPAQRAQPQQHGQPQPHM